MLWPDEARNVAQVLTEVLALNGGRDWFSTVFPGSQFAVELGSLAGPAASYELVAASAVQVCVLREYTDDPAWLLRLVQGIANYSGAGGVGSIANLNEIVQRLQTRVNIHDLIWNDVWVRDWMPFVDRHPLRRSLTELSRSGGRPILRIDGPDDSGKSYSHELLQHASQNGGWQFQVIRVQVEEGADLLFNAFSLAQLIVGELGGDNTLQASGLSDPSFPNIPLLQAWILKNVKASGKRCWLFLDGFRYLKEGNSARKLIQGLADKIANDNYRQWLRMILVDYDEPLARVEDDRIAYDSISAALPAAAAERAVEDCLRTLYLQLQKTVQPDELKAKVRAVLSNIPPSEPWMAGLNKVVRAAAKGIRNGG